MRWPFSKVQITTLSWTVCWITRTQQIHAGISLCTHVISLTHVIRDYLCEQITDLNPWPSLHFESHAPCSLAHHIEQITIPFSDRLLQSTICCNAEARGVRQDLSYPFKDDHSSHLQEKFHYRRQWGQLLNTDPLSVSVCILRRIQQSMKHVRLMIFCNWISKKAGDKVPHTPLILPISTADQKRAVHRWIWRKGRKENGAWSEEEHGDRRWRGVWIAATTSWGRTASKGASTRPNTHGLISISVLGVRWVRGGREPGKDQHSKHSNCCCKKCTAFTTN